MNFDVIEWMLLAPAPFCAWLFDLLPSWIVNDTILSMSIIFLLMPVLVPMMILGWIVGVLVILGMIAISPFYFVYKLFHH